jgi:serine/threonine protein kinase
MNPELLCMGCMGTKGSAMTCPECGWREGTLPENPMQLPPRTVLIGRYCLGQVLGQGGFGITYLGWDLTLNRKLAIKEHFPREICSRGRDGHTVRPTQRGQQSFENGLKSFVKEGQTLARFQEYAGIVTMLDFFSANGTAYIVMAHVDGLNLDEYLMNKDGKIPFDLALSVLIPMMDALREVHAAGLLHRDIKPANIYINRASQVKLLDFGSARHEMRDKEQKLTILTTTGYSPIEQYSSSGDQQGPWTDVYALAATLYRAITGRPPLDPADRLSHDGLLCPSQMGIPIPPRSEAALMKALSVRREGRFQTVAEFQDAISIEDLPPGRRSNYWPLALAVVVLALIAAAWLSFRSDPLPAPQLPSVILRASPTALHQGETVTLSWSSMYATRLELTSPEGMVSANLNGSVRVTPDRSTIYSITASGPGGTGTQSVTIEVEASPHCTNCTGNGPQKKTGNVAKPNKPKFRPDPV